MSEFIYYIDNKKYETNTAFDIPWDELHRDAGPALYLPDGEIRWYKNGSVHREDGPAILNDTSDPYGSIKIRWFLRGFEYDFEDYLNHIDKRLLVKLIWG